MKTLYIVRHAKSSWNYPHLSDDERPLLEKGKKRTKKVIDYLLEQRIKVDLIISSYAVRAFDTARILGNALNYPEDEIHISERMYYGSVTNIFNIFYDLSDKVKSLMIVGHNPTLTNFVNIFLNEKIDWLPTSGIVCIEFNAYKWDKISKAKKNIKFVITPKMMYNNKKQKNINLNE